MQTVVPIPYWFVGFDSILVRLKAKVIATGLIDRDKFRFHTGSIKSQCLRLDLDTRESFDSILVRLKVYFDEELSSFEVGFDSILVRLKGSQDSPDPDKTREFRFHTGSIKRVADGA